MLVRFATGAAWSAAAAISIAVSLSGCNAVVTEPPKEKEGVPKAVEDFVSDSPSPSPDFTDPPWEQWSDSLPVNVGGDPAASADSSGTAERALVEADITQVRNGELYVLSRRSGLSVIDISRRDRLSLVGQYRLDGAPLEMYIEDSVLYVVSTRDERADDEVSSLDHAVQTSRIEALDVGDPEHIKRLGSFDLPGYIKGSRVVGDVLYATTFETGKCWGCQSTPNTAITSLAIGDPTSIHVVSQLHFYDEGYPYDPALSYQVTMTPQRIYVTVTQWSYDRPFVSTLQVVDISDPGGQLVMGASVEIDGEIHSPWQVDEHDGVLRVISTASEFTTRAPTEDTVPQVHTFSVVSSNEIRPLGHTLLRVPPSYSITSTRFDGDRAYVCTWLWDIDSDMSSLLTVVDLSDAANPVQGGTLEELGIFKRLLPRGNRLLALHARSGMPDLSLFDVAEPDYPRMLDRVYARAQEDTHTPEDEAPNWARNYDKERYTLLEDLGAVLMPYGAHSHDPESPVLSYDGGLQIIDFTHDTLTKRGVVPTRAHAWRAFTHDGRLFVLSGGFVPVVGDEVQTVNLENRDAPAKSDALDVSLAVNKTVVVGDVIARLSHDRSKREVQLQIAPASEPGRAQPIGVVDLMPTLGSFSYYDDLEAALDGGRLFAHGQNVYLVWGANDDSETRLAVIDVADPAAPRIASQISLPFGRGVLMGHTGDIVSAPGDTVVQLGSTLAFRHLDRHGYSIEAGTGPLRQAWIEVVDLSNPARPVLAATVPLPEAAGYTALQVEGTTVLTSHWVPLPDDSARARFYFDRIDLATPGAPIVSPPVNVPGALLAWDGAVSRMLTVDYQRLTRHVDARDECERSCGDIVIYQPDDPDRDRGAGTCGWMRRALKLLDVRATGANLRDESPIEDGIAIREVAAGDDRVFFVGDPGGQATEAVYGPYDADTKLFVASGLRSGSLRVENKAANVRPSEGSLVATGQRLVFAGEDVGEKPLHLSVLDASDLDNLTLATKRALPFWVSNMTLSGNRAICSLGDYGIESVDLGR